MKQKPDRDGWWWVCEEGKKFLPIPRLVEGKMVADKPDGKWQTLDEFINGRDLVWFASSMPPKPLNWREK
jgi:hypothetical protein